MTHNSVPVVYRRNGKNVGELYQNVLYKKVKASRHLFKALDAWGVDAKLLEKVLIPTDAVISITDTEEKKQYLIKSSYAKRVGLFYHFKELKEDHGTQIFIQRKEFNVKII
jgi:hypothetical protein